MEARQFAKSDCIDEVLAAIVPVSDVDGIAMDEHIVQDLPIKVECIVEVCAAEVGANWVAAGAPAHALRPSALRAEAPLFVPGAGSHPPPRGADVEELLAALTAVASDGSDCAEQEQPIEEVSCVVCAETVDIVMEEVTLVVDGVESDELPQAVKQGAAMPMAELPVITAEAFAPPGGLSAPRTGCPMTVSSAPSSLSWSISPACVTPLLWGSPLERRQTRGPRGIAAFTIGRR